MTETNHNQNAYRLRELSDGLDKLAGLARGLRADSSSQASAIDAVWENASLILRLKFVRDVLPEESALQPVLRQASALEELRQRGGELETWVIKYPSLFADAMMLITNTGALQKESTAEGRDPAVWLAMLTLVDAQQALDRELADYGIEWILSAPGGPITSGHEVVGEEPSAAPRTTIARSVRSGFRRKGRLELPAQVVRSSGPPGTRLEDQAEADQTPDAQRPTPNAQRPIPNPPPPFPTTFAALTGKGETNQCLPTPNAQYTKPNPPTPFPNSFATLTGKGERAGFVRTPNTEHRTPNTCVPTPNTERRTPIPDPEWLRILGQRTHGCNVGAVNEIVKQLRKLVAAADQPDSQGTCEEAGNELAPVLAPLASLLNMRYADSIAGIGEEWGAALLEARDPILSWLRETLAIEPINPQRGAAFDPSLMDAIETRRTVHANEIETVARVERIGLIQNGLPILRAEVVRYVAGENS